MNPFTVEPHLYNPDRFVVWFRPENADSEVIQILESERLAETLRDKLNSIWPK